MEQAIIIRNDSYSRMRRCDGEFNPFLISVGMAIQKQIVEWPSEDKASLDLLEGYIMCLSEEFLAVEGLL